MAPRPNHMYRGERRNLLRAHRLLRSDPKPKPSTSPVVEQMFRFWVMNRSSASLLSVKTLALPWHRRFRKRHLVTLHLDILRKLFNSEQRYARTGKPWVKPNIAGSTHYFKAMKYVIASGD